MIDVEAIRKSLINFKLLAFILGNTCNMHTAYTAVLHNTYTKLKIFLTNRRVFF